MKYDFSKTSSLVRGLTFLCLTGFAGFALTACFGGGGACPDGKTNTTYEGTTKCRASCESNSDCDSGKTCSDSGYCVQADSNGDGDGDGDGDGNGDDQDAGTMDDAGGDDIGFTGNGSGGDSGTTDDGGGGGGGDLTCSESPDVEADCFEGLQCSLIFRQAENQSCALAAQNSLTDQASTRFEEFNSCVENSCSDACGQGSGQEECSSCIDSNCRGETGGSCETDDDCSSDFPTCYEGTCVAQDAPADYCQPQFVAQDSGYECSRISLCLQNCGENDMECQQGCLQNAGGDAGSQYQAFLQCASSECGQGAGQECFTRIVQPGGACAEEFYTCFDCPQPSSN